MWAGVARSVRGHAPVGVGARQELRKPCLLWAGRDRDFERAGHKGAYAGGGKGVSVSTPDVDGASYTFQKPRPMWAKPDIEIQQASPMWAYVSGQRESIRNYAPYGPGKKEFQQICHI